MWALAGLAATVTVLGSVILWTVARPDSGAGDSGQPSAGDRTEREERSDEDDVPRTDDRPDRSSLEECGRSETLTIPFTDISVEPLTREREIEIGQEVVDEVLATYTLSDDPAQQQRLAGLLDRIVPATTDADYSVRLIDADEVNAFALPGGALMFTTAIVELLDDGELGFVMGHEVAHVECRHIARQLEREALTVTGIDELFGDLVDAQQLYESEVGQTLAFLGSLSFSREDESESDLVALDLMATADIPLTEAVEALEQLRSIEGDVPSEGIIDFLLTHPPTEDRIEAVQADIASR